MILNMTITGTSSTKSIMIISIDSGSTVAVYSDAACTTKVKDAVEKNEGEFWVTDLNNGDYYIKATIDTFESIMPYSINQYGVYRITMTYIPDQVIDYLMLYDPTIGEGGASGGNTNPDVTGGYVTYKGSAADFQTNRIAIGTLYQQPKAVSTANKIDLTGYTFFKARGSKAIGLNTTRPSSANYTYSTTSQLVEIDSTDSMYCCCYVSTSNAATSYVYHAFLLKNDNLTSMVARLGLTNNTTDTILASASDIAILLGSEEAVRWMCATCTGDFMWKALTNSTFQDAYADSAYKSIIDANIHWAKFITLAAS